MPKEQERAQPVQRGREADRALAKGFRPLALPAVAAAAKAMARRPDSQEITGAQRLPAEHDEG